MVTTDQDALKRFIDRRHPDYAERLAHWNFLESTYSGGRDWFHEHIFQYIKEGEKEFNDRIKRAYRFNHTREVVDLLQKYIFKAPAIRNFEDATDEVETFWENATLGGLDISQFMRLLSTETSKYGRIWVFTDTNKTSEVALSVHDAKKAGVRVYTYMVRPQNVLDMGFDDLGNLTWILVYETVRDDADPITSSGKVEGRYRLWTADSWFVFKQVEAGSRGKVVVIADEGTHDFGSVPAFAVDHVIGENRYSAPGLIEDIAYLDRASANYLSNLDAIIQDQTFSQLAMPAQNLMPGEEGHDKLLEMGTKRIFIYDGEGGVPPAYISPDVKQAQIIVTVINKIISEIYHTVGMAGERTKEDNAVGIDNSSGVAKAYDFERVNSLLAAKADSLENAENRLVEAVCRWNNAALPKEELVKYPDTFDVRSLYDEFTIAENLSTVSAPDEVRREQMKQIIDKLFPRLAAELKTKMLDELKKWPVDPIEHAAALAAATAPPTAFGDKNASTKKTPASKNASTQNRQGQVTSQTA